MLASKSYQDSSSLQAIYRLSIVRSKLFLSIFKRAKKGAWTWILRAILAEDIERDVKTISRRVDDLVKLGLVEKVRHAVNVAHECAYKITDRGYEVVDIIRKLHDYSNAIVLTTCLLATPGEKSVPRVNLDVFIQRGISSLRESKLQTAPARDPKNTPILLTTARKEVDVGSKEHKTMDLPDHVVSLTPLLQLTTHGQIKLSMFDKETVDFAWDAVKQSTGCKDIFKELVNICLQYCEDNDKPKDWNIYYGGLDAGLATKKDFFTKKRITSEMIKPRIVKDSRGSETQAVLVQTERERMRQRQLDWQAKQTAQDLERKLAIARLETASLIGVEVPSPSFLEVEVVEAKPAEWSQTDKQLVDWALDYINKMSMGKQFYIHYEQEILLGPDSPRAKTGELQAGLRLMQRLYFQELANRVETTPVTKVVTELKDQIVCAQIANDEKVWDNLTYSPVEGDEVFEEIYD